MLRQMSQFGMGIILVTLLVLGLSNKGTYGKVPASFIPGFGKSRDVERTQFTPPIASPINSLFVKSDGSTSTTLIILVAYDSSLAHKTEAGFAGQTPLILSVSTLPFKEARFDPTLVEFEQDGHTWRPVADGESFPIVKTAPFGGRIRDGQIHQGVVMLPGEFDLSRPLTIRYLSSHRVLRF